MKIFNASLSKGILQGYHKRFPQKKVNVLRSFGRLDSEMSSFTGVNRFMIGSLILDSGAWTLNEAKTQGSKITIGTYIEYIKSFGASYDLYFNLDSDFSDTGFANNLQNLTEMEKEGLAPVPVIHDIWGEGIDYYIGKKYPFVALGSKQIEKKGHLSIVMDKFRQTSIKVHLFGNKKFDLIANFPIHSCDTVGWANAGRYGLVYYWNPLNQGEDKTDKIYFEDFYNSSRKNPKQKYSIKDYNFIVPFQEYLRKDLNLSIDDLQGQNAFYCRQLANLHFFVILEEKITEIHHQKGFNTDW